MCVVISTMAPIEFPGYAAANGPYITSMRSTSAGATMPQRGDAVELLLPISAESSTPSA